MDTVQYRLDDAEPRSGILNGILSLTERGVWKGVDGLIAVTDFCVGQANRFSIRLGLTAEFHGGPLDGWYRVMQPGTEPPHCLRSQNPSVGGLEVEGEFHYMLSWVADGRAHYDLISEEAFAS